MPRLREDEDDEEDEYHRRQYRRGDGLGRTRRGSGHSTIGILSFLAAILSGVSILGLFGAAGLVAANGGDVGEDSPEAILAGLGLFAGMGVALLGLILGVIGLNQGANKLFPTLGTSISGVVLLGSVALLCAGALAG